MPLTKKPRRIPAGPLALGRCERVRDYLKHPAEGTLQHLVGLEFKGHMQCVTNDQALERTVGAATSWFAAADTTPRWTRDVLSASRCTPALPEGAMIIWNVMAVLPQDGQRLAHEGHSRSHAPQTRACCIDMTENRGGF
jgi:hypothetical protein